MVRVLYFLIVCLQIWTMMVNSFFIETQGKSNTTQTLKLPISYAVLGTSHVESMIVINFLITGC